MSVVFEHEGEHGSQWAAISSIAVKLRMTPETLRKWVHRAEAGELTGCDAYHDQQCSAVARRLVGIASATPPQYWRE